MISTFPDAESLLCIKFVFQTYKSKTQIETTDHTLEIAHCSQSVVRNLWSKKNTDFYTDICDVLGSNQYDFTYQIRQQNE